MGIQGPVIKVEGSEVSYDREDLITLGRDPRCIVHVDHPRVSREHGELRLVGQTWEWRDLSSSGSYVDGERVSEIVIRQPISIRLGHPTLGPLLEVIPRGARAGTSGTASHRRPPRTEPWPFRGTTSPLSIGSYSVSHPTDDVVTIGRAAENDIVFSDDLRVSRFHAELRRLDGGYEIVDLGSRAGTFVDGVRTGRAPIVEGAVIGIDRHLLVLRDGRLDEFVDDSAALVAEGLTVRAGRRTLVSNLELAIPPASLVAIVGPTGAGKSTAMKALTGFAPAQQGRVSYNGRDVYRSMDELRHRIGYVPQDDILHTQLPLRRALLFAAKLRFAADVTWVERRRRVDEVLEDLGLTDRGGLTISKLSGGQRKRASVALELLTKPALLFLDEPTSGLDPGFERSIMELLRSLADEGRTVVVVTHSTASLDLCDRVLVLAPGGATAYFGPPADLLSYFGAHDHAEMFRRLQSENDQDWNGTFRASPYFDRYVRRPQQDLSARNASERRVSPARRRPRGGLSQTWTLAHRNIRVIMGAPGYAALLLLQAPVISLLVLAALGGENFEPLGESSGGFSQARLLALVVVLAVGAMGLVNSCREIVRELPVYVRERVVGLSLGAYLSSKLVVLTGLATIQVLVVTVLVLTPQAIGSGGLISHSSLADITMVLLLTLVACSALGLAVSAIVSTDAAALVLVPVLIVAQLVLANAAIPLQSPGLAEAAYTAPSFWGFAGVASATDLLAVEGSCRPGRSPVLIPGVPVPRELQREIDARTTSPSLTCHRLFDHDRSMLAGSAAALLLLTLGYLMLAAWALQRRDPLRHRQ